MRMAVNKVEAMFSALQKFHNFINSPENVFNVKLKSGKWSFPQYYITNLFLSFGEYFWGVYFVIQHGLNVVGASRLSLLDSKKKRFRIDPYSGSLMAWWIRLTHFYDKLTREIVKIVLTHIDMVMFTLLKTKSVRICPQSAPSFWVRLAQN